jgi:hypothetical protein
LTRSIPWLRVFAEGAVIVVSILLAFGIDAAWEERQEREREATALLSLQADLVADSIELEALRRRLVVWREGAGWVDQHVGRDVPADSVEIVLRRLFAFNLYQPVSSVYDGLRDSGQLGLLSDDALRDEIIRYYEVRQPYMIQFRDLVMPRFARVLDASSELVDLRLLPESEGMAHFATYRRWSELTRRSEFVSEVLWFGLFAAGHELRVREVLEDVASLRGLIEAGLGS